MFGFFEEPSDLDKALTYAHSHLASYDPSTEEYAKILTHVTELHAIKTSESKGGLSADTFAMVAANLGGIMLILGHERVNVITSKALGFIWKTR